MRVLVTGGAGFLGTNLSIHLARRGHRVLIIDSFTTARRENQEALREAGCQVVRSDLADWRQAEGILRTFDGFDRIYHLACPASPRHYQRLPVYTLHTSFVATDFACRMAERDGARMLFTSTSEVYGDPKTSPQFEDYWGHVNPVGPRSMYDEGKRVAEAMIVSRICAGNPLNARIVRVFNTYGPYMSPDDGRMVPNFICRALTGKPLTVYGDGRQTRSLCYVDDLVEGLVTVMEAPDGNPLVTNLGRPDERSVLEIAQMVQQLVSRIGRQAVAWIQYEDLPIDDPTVRCPAIRRAIDLGWEPKTDLETGLTKTIEWFRSVA